MAQKLRKCSFHFMMEGDHLKDSDVGGSIILKWIFEKLNGGMD